MNLLLEHISQYCKLSDAALSGLESVLKKNELAKGTMLVSEGRVCSQVYFLEKGCVRGYYTLEGKEITYWFAFENTFVTSLYSFITRKPGAENIQLLEDCVLWSVSHADLQRLYNNFPDIERLGRVIHERYYVMLEERFLSIHFKEARERYDALLKNTPHILQRVPLGFVASYLGITQETLSRIRSKP
jgi:CRP-like cAMP-binding protein